MQRKSTVGQDLDTADREWLVRRVLEVEDMHLNFILRGVMDKFRYEITKVKNGFIFKFKSGYALKEKIGTHVFESEKSLKEFANKKIDEALNALPEDKTDMDGEEQ